MNESTRSPESPSGWGYSSLSPAPSVFHEEDQAALRDAPRKYRESMDAAQRPPTGTQPSSRPNAQTPPAAHAAAEETVEAPLSPDQKRIRELLGMKRIDALVRKGDIVAYEDGTFWFASDGLAHNWGIALGKLEARDAKEAQQAATKDAASAAEQAEELRKLRAEVEAMKAGLNKDNRQAQAQPVADTLVNQNMSGVDGFNAMAARQAEVGRGRRSGKEWHWFPKTMIALTTAALVGSGVSVGVNTLQARQEVKSWSSALDLGLSSSMDQAALFFTRR